MPGGLASYRALGAVGSGVVMLGGLMAGVTPADDFAAMLPVIGRLRMSTTVSVLVIYVGVTMLLLAWWRVGSLVRDPGGLSWRELATTGACWAAPFALANPIFSRDVYSYLAQGAMTAAGLDPYRLGPSAIGGPLAANVPDIWQRTAAPYGPVFLEVAGGVTNVTGDGVWLGIMGMRLVAVAGVGMLLWSIPRIARHCGVPPAAAVWLGVLNPLVLLHLVADAHNEALMLGLMSAGLALALERRPMCGVILITMAALVKAPAIVALAFVVPIWAAQLTGRRRRLRAGQRVLAVAGLSAVAITFLSGTGFGWTRTLNTPTAARTWMSVSTDLGYLLGTAARQLTGQNVLDQTRQVCWLAGLAVAAGVGGYLWWRSDRFGPLVALGLCLTTIVVASPVVHPWYLLWGMVPLAAAAKAPAIRRTVAAGSAALVLLVLPGGVDPGLPAFAGALLGTSAVALVWVGFVGLARNRPIDLLRPTWRSPAMASAEAG